jgi:3-isopropylmalate/(R)-2-methylmalate dehydratase small subunit
VTPITKFSSRTIVLPQVDIDTDQIIPARFLTTTTREGLGQHLFADWRYDAAGRERPEFVLNQPPARDAGVLVAGHNFGCGSSREHAPWALLDFGIRAVISTEIADIFLNNALKNGLIPVLVDAAIHAKLLAAPGAPVTVDLARSELTLADGTTAVFPIDRFARYCLLNGVDQLGYLLENVPAIQRFEEQRA